MYDVACTSVVFAEHGETNASQTISQQKGPRERYMCELDIQLVCSRGRASQGNMKMRIEELIGRLRQGRMVPALLIQKYMDLEGAIPRGFSGRLELEDLPTESTRNYKT